jgi:hypothetical protein
MFSNEHWQNVEGTNSNSITASFTDIRAIVGRAVDTHTTRTKILCVYLIWGLAAPQKLGHNPIGQSMYRYISEK